MMDIPISIEELKLFRKISQLADSINLETYIVGGFVRDKLLGRETKDIDLVCIGDATIFAEMCYENLKESTGYSVFKNYGTAHFVYKNIDLEFVGARKESYNLDSRNPEIEPGTLEDDQKRRDFTINALAVSLNGPSFGKLIDPFNGLDDLHKKILKTPLDPLVTFSDDPLRILRAIRFASQLNFELDENTWNAIKVDKQRIDIVSKERISEELNKIMLQPIPSKGFRLLYDAGVLHFILPELCELQGVEYIEGKGHKDNFYHSLEVMDNLAQKSTDLWLRWAALLHDVGKAPTKKFEPQHGWTFHAHDFVGGKMVKNIFKRLKLPLHDKMLYVKKLVELHLRPISLSNENITDSALRRLLFDAGTDIDDLMMLCESDITSKNEDKVKRVLNNFSIVRKKLKEVEEKDKITNWKPPIDGQIIMDTFGLNQGKLVGNIKQEIKEAILDAKINNTFEDAYEYMLSIAKNMGLEKIK